MSLASLRASLDACPFAFISPIDCLISSSIPPAPISLAGFAAGGFVIEGSGFNVTKAGTGAYDISFTTPFSAKPSTTASMDTDLGTAGSALTQASSTQVVKIRLFATVGTTTSAKDGQFSFIAIGPR
jgi:hypothetical protein